MLGFIVRINRGCFREGGALFCSRTKNAGRKTNRETFNNEQHQNCERQQFYLYGGPGEVCRNKKRENGGGGLLKNSSQGGVIFLKTSFFKRYFLNKKPCQESETITFFFL